MAGPRVVQDSDESDAEFSDTTTSIDPLQDLEHPPAHTRDDNGQVEEPDDVPSDGGGMITENSEPVVNFDSFLATQSQDVTLVTASQKQREELWIGQGVAGSVGLRSASADISSLNRGIKSPNSKPSFSAETLDTMMLKRGRTMGPPDNIDNLKKRRMGDVDDSFRTMNYNHTQESSFDIFATTDTTSSANGPSGQFPTEIYNVNPSLHQQITAAPTSEQSTTMQMLHVEIPQQSSSNVPSTHRSLNHSKSMSPDPDSTHDTEPMSSITFAHARRAITDFVDVEHQVPSGASPDVLVIPVSADPRTFESTMKSKSRARTPGHVSSDENELASEYYGGIQKELNDPKPSCSKSKFQESVEFVEAEPEPETKDGSGSQNHVPNDQDEFNSEDFSGIPTELYKPRPSRSRSKLQEPLEVTEDEPEPEDRETFRFEDHVYSDRYEPDFAHMPKEIYNPKPSRSRSKPHETVEKIEVARETKGKKRCGSPDHNHIVSNSDEFRGMSKEQYKPRPSRSRGKRSDLVYIDQDVQKGRDPGLAVVIPQEATTERVEHVEQKHVDKIKSEPVDEDSHDVQSSSEGNHEEPVNEVDPIDTIAAQDIEILVSKPPAPSRKGRKRKGTVDSVATSRANSKVPEKPARKKRGRSKKKAAGSPVAGSVIVPDLDGPFNEATTSVATESREPLADYDPNTNQQQHPEESTALSNSPQPDLDDTSNRQASPQPQLQNPSENGQREQDFAPSTPKKQPEPPTTPAKVEKGPDKHSPISTRNKVPYRVGLSRRAKIAPLLKVVRK